LKGETSGFGLMFSDRGRYYQNLIESGAYEQLSRAVDSDVSEYGENDILTRVYWIHSRLLLGTFPCGMLGLALNRVLRQVVELLKTTTPAEVESPTTGALNSDIRAATSALGTLTPLVINSLSDSPELVLSIQEAWDDLTEVIAPPQIVNTINDDDQGSKLLKQSSWPALSATIEKGQIWASDPAVHGFCKGLFLLLSPLLIYSLWSQSRPGGVGSQVLNWVQGREPLVRTDLLGPNDEAWLPPDGAQRWKAVELQKTNLILPILARIEKLEGLQEISYSLEASRGAEGSLGSDNLIKTLPAIHTSAGSTTAHSLVANDEKTGLPKNSQADVGVVEEVRKQVLPAALASAGAAPNVKARVGGLDIVDTTGPVETVMVEPELGAIQTPAYGGEFPRERYFVTRGRSDEQQKAGWKEPVSEPGDYYEIRIPTFIFEHPSLSSYRIASLEIGDEVLGKEVMGRWIKVVSHQGGVGFLPVNDARRAYSR
jgi:hypothetical protein